MWIDLENTEENSDKIGKIWKKKEKISWIVKRYPKYGRKVSWIVKCYGKYRRKLWKDTQNMEDKSFE